MNKGCVIFAVYMLCEIWILSTAQLSNHLSISRMGNILKKGVFCFSLNTQQDGGPVSQERGTNMLPYPTACKKTKQNQIIKKTLGI